MTIATGTDFSQAAATATDVAAALAQRMQDDLVLVHVVGSDAPPSGAGRDDSVQRRLEAEVQRLQPVRVQGVLTGGEPHQQIVAIGVETGARLLVLGSVGQGRTRPWVLGSVADKVAQHSPVPVLVVRDGARLLAWLRQERPLAVLVGVEPTAGSLAALTWAQSLRRVGPCSVTATQVVWPPELQPVAGPGRQIPLDVLDPEVAGRLREELRTWAQRAGLAAETTFDVRPGWGRVDSHLLQVAAEGKADLVVVGTHQRAGIARLWQGSVSRGVLHDSPVSVACVPMLVAGR